jgi:hypothetical protein
MTMRMLNRAVLGFGAAAVVGATTARAQSPLSAEIDGGAATVAGGTYTDRAQFVAGGQLALRIADFPATELLLGASGFQYFGSSRMYVYPACGNCGIVVREPVPSFGMLAATIGIRRHLGAGASVGVEGGIGPVHARFEGTHLGVVWRADAAFHVAGPAHFVIAAQMISWTPGPNTLHAYPITIGLRLQ